MQVSSQIHIPKERVDAVAAAPVSAPAFYVASTVCSAEKTEAEAAEAAEAAAVAAVSAAAHADAADGIKENFI